MAIATGTAIIGSAILGAGAAMHASGQQRKSADKAIAASQQGADQSIAFQREARDYARQVLSKYSAEGDAARSKMNTFLGLNGVGSVGPSGVAAPAVSAAPINAAPSPDFAGYVRNNPDLMRAHQTGSWVPGRGKSLEEFGREHYRLHGQGEGRQLPQAGGTAAIQGTGQVGVPEPVQGATAADPTMTPEEAQEQAWVDYTKTPWGRIGQVETDRATGEFLSRAGAGGAAISGRTARGMAEVANESQLRNFNNYYGAIGAVADTGFTADTGIASAGQAFADNAAHSTHAAAQARSNAEIAKGRATADGINDLASWVGWGVGSFPGADSRSTPASPGAIPYAPTPYTSTAQSIR